MMVVVGGGGRSVCAGGGLFVLRSLPRCAKTMIIMCAMRYITNINEGRAREVPMESAPIKRRGSDKELGMKGRRQRADR